SKSLRRSQISRSIKKQPVVATTNRPRRACKRTQSIMVPSSKKSVNDLRAMLEGFAARHAAFRVSQGAEASDLWECFQLLQQSSQQEVVDNKQLAQTDRAFHHAAVRLADVPGLARIIHESWNL
ncbi:MAG: FCD domain-containing protein, partial [Pirellulaceae bacterium]